MPLRSAFEQAAQGVVGLLNVFTGGAVQRMAVFALGIMPYITASIIIHAYDDGLAEAGSLEEGRQRRGAIVINQYTRYGTVFLAAIQAYGIAVGLESSGTIVTDPGWFFRLTTVITLVGGTIFLMWLGEQITARGVGNGISLIIFAGIVAELPRALAQTLELGRQGAIGTGLILGIIILAIVVITFIVLVRACPASVAHPVS